MEAHSYSYMYTREMGVASDVSQQDKQTDRRSGIGIYLMLAGRKSTDYAKVCER